MPFAFQLEAQTSYSFTLPFPFSRLQLRHHSENDQFAGPALDESEEGGEVGQNARLSRVVFALG